MARPGRGLAMQPHNALGETGKAVRLLRYEICWKTDQSLNQGGTH
jgi:hypothetical protein